MSRLFSLGLVLAAALTLVSCDLWNHEDEAAPDLLPLAVGSEWVMSFQKTSVDSEVIELGRDTLRVVASQSIGGETWFELRNTGRHSFARVLGGLYTNRESGVWKWRDRSNPESKPYLVYAYPTEPGAAYDLPGESNIRVAVLDTEAAITTPAGMFEAHLYEFDSDEPYGYSVEDDAARFLRYLVPGQGFAQAGCKYLRPSEEGTLTAWSEITWLLESFEE